MISRFCSVKSFPAAQLPLTSAARTSPFHLRCGLHQLSLSQLHSRHGLHIRATDAVQPWDCEAYPTNECANLKIAIVGFGNFGQFLAKTLVRQGHSVYVHSRSNYVSIAQSMGVQFIPDIQELFNKHPDVVVICTSIISTKVVLKAMPFQLLKRSTLFVDVLSVKVYPKRLFLELLPKNFDILCTHPMFGPISGRHGWRDLSLVFEKVRIENADSRLATVEQFLNIFRNEGCQLVEMSCEEHDQFAAESQFITHTVGRILEKMHLKDTPINTKDYQTFLHLIQNISRESLDLYYGLFVYNGNTRKQLDRLALAFDSLKEELYGHLHEASRKQLLGKLKDECEN